MKNPFYISNTGYEQQQYSLLMTYDNLHNIVSKEQLHQKAPGQSGGTFIDIPATTYRLDYSYDANNKPHAPREITDKPYVTSTGNDVKTKLYDYDPNGNLTNITQKTGDSDAGGERILKHSNTSVSIYLNGKKVADTIQVNAALYPSGMLVAKLGNNGSEEEQTLAYTKHYFAGTQRVSSKIGTTENLGDYLYDWFTQGTGGPVDVIGSSFGVLENAEQGVVQVYDDLGIEPPVYDSNPVFIPVQSFVHGGNEIEQYFFHPDHLGSTSYITNLLGEVSQHMEYFAFGETFVEEHRSSNNSPYKFNGKELDEETGWYYYGARYYDPRISVWLSVDPLAEQTMTPYQYTYQNPVRYIDPTGMAGEENLVDDPIYGKNFWGNLKYLGDDGKNNGRVYFVSGQTKRDVKNATANGEFYTGNLDSSSEVSSVPSQMIFAVDNSLRATLSSGKENGGHNTFSSFETIQWDEGPEIQQLQVAEGILTKGSVVPFVVDGNRINIDVLDLDVYYHLHPDVMGLGNSTPSNYIDGEGRRRGDIPSQAYLESRGYKGNPFVVGARDKRVNFYNSNGSVMKVKYEQFRNVLLSEFLKHIRL